MSSVRRSRLLLVTLLAAALAGCGSNEGSGAEPRVPLTAAPVTAGPAGGTPVDALVPDSLQFTVPLVGGGQLDGAALAGQPVAFWFWAPT